jgi:C4-dicarboxylate-specific signal transduction histidine kinase
LRRTRDELESRVEERQAELARVSRMLTVGEMGVSVAHEVNQPLMAIVLNGDACVSWLSAHPPNLEEVKKAVERIVEEGTRAGEIVQRMRALSGKTALQKLPVDLNEVVNDVGSLLHRELSQSQVIFRTELTRKLPPVLGDSVQLQQVVFNLAINAIEAMKGENRQQRHLCISTERLSTGEVMLAVEDSGPGFPAGDPEQMFAAFYTTKPEGIGIGLSISRTIIEAHGGRIRASNLASGARFQIELPAHA